MPTRFRLSMLAAAVAVLCVGGCVSPRDVAAEWGHPKKRVCRDAVVPPLAPGESHYFAEIDSAGGQSLCVLRLAPAAIVKKQYHKRQDLTLTIIQGHVIVQVEKTRYLVGPAESVLLPRLTAYAILPRDGSAEVLATMVFSPSFSAADTVVVK